MQLPKPLYRAGKSALVLIEMVAIQLAIQLFYTGLVVFFVPEKDSWVIGYFLSFVTTLVIFWFYLIKLDNYFLEDVGYKPLGLKALNLLWQVPLGVGLTILLTKLIGLRNSEPYAKAIQEQLSLGEVSLVTAMIGIINVGVLIPIVSEFQKRRLVNDILATKLGLLPVIFVNSLLMAVMNYTSLPALHFFFGAVVANLLYFKYQSLWASVAFMGVMGVLEFTGILFKLVELIG